MTKLFCMLDQSEGYHHPAKKKIEDGAVTSIKVEAPRSVYVFAFFNGDYGFTLFLISKKTKYFVLFENFMLACSKMLFSKWAFRDLRPFWITPGLFDYLTS